MFFKWVRFFFLWSKQRVRFSIEFKWSTKNKKGELVSQSQVKRGWSSELNITISRFDLKWWTEKTCIDETCRLLVGYIVYYIRITKIPITATLQLTEWERNVNEHRLINFFSFLLTSIFANNLRSLNLLIIKKKTY